MTRSLKIVLMVFAGIVLILAIVLAVVFSTRGDQTNLNQLNDANQNLPAGTLPVKNRLVINDNNTVVETVDNATVLDDGQKQQVSLEQLARTFTSRFGTYSNQGNFENFKDLQPMMTTSMRNWSDTYIADNSKGASNDYWGVTTSALSIKSSEIGDSEATIVVTSRRKEMSAGGDYKVYNQDLKLSFKKANGVWLVDGAYWQ